MKLRLYIVFAALAFSACYNTKSPQYFGHSVPPPSPFEQYKTAAGQCLGSISPMKEVLAALNTCIEQGTDKEDNVASARCSAEIIQKEAPAILVNYPILRKIQKTANLAPISASPTTPAYQIASDKIEEDFKKFLDIVKTRHIHSLVKCDNEALLQYVANTSSSPSAFYEYAATREEIALKQQNNQLTYSEAKIAYDAAVAQLLTKIEAANNQRRQEALIQAQINAANSQAQAAQAQASAARYAAFQNALQNLNHSLNPPPQPQYFPRQTNCHMMGAFMNCTNF